MPSDPNKTQMMAEIKEQPQTLRATIESVFKQSDEVRRVFGAKMKRASSVFLVGCGTSYHAAIAGRHALRVFAHLPSIACPASEFRDFETRKKRDIIIAISQSGETGDVLAAVERGIKEGCTIVSVTNEPKSTLADLSEIAIVTKAGSELAVPMTKTYTALLAGIFSIAEAIGTESRGTTPLQNIPRISEETINTAEPKIRRFSEQLKGAESIFLLGRGPSYATALEASLKLKEAALVHAEGFQSPEFRHGPKALLEIGTSLIAFTNSNELDDTTSRLLEEVKTTSTSVISIGDRAGSTIETPQISYYLTPLVDIIPLQILAVCIAVQKGINPDNPRSLTKVTTST
jgi:glucosamine--fructose-6-phosphate aminotransferase (isomerizing)